MVDVRHETVNAVYGVEGYATLVLGLGERGEKRGREEVEGTEGGGMGGSNEARIDEKRVERQNARITICSINSIIDLYI